MAQSPTTIVDEMAIALSNMGNAASGAFTPTLRLGVTGLSRSGKTVFITSLVKNLLDGERLAGFSPAYQGRFIGAKLTEHPDKAIPRFAYEKHLASLTGANKGSVPVWPASTNNISQLRLTLKYQSNKWFGAINGPNTLNLDIVDYPGEWLLDLPLLSQNYTQWSKQTLAHCDRTAQTSETKTFLAALQPLKKDQEANEDISQNLAKLFTAHLQGARITGRSMSTLPPGRFLMPGDMKDSPALTFSPLPAALQNLQNDSLYALMQRRYEAYKSIVIRPFFRDHFATLDRQIVLVDALRALHAGPDAISDLQEALNSVLACFRQGNNNPLSKIFAKKIDRILFVATKADHVHHTSHSQLLQIINKLVARAAKAARFSGAQTKTIAIASVRATSEGVIKDKEGELACLIGTPEKGEVLEGITYDGKSEIALFPGDLPKDADSIFEQTLKPGLLNFMRFSPPENLKSTTRKNSGLPHIRLDKAIDYLLEDWMR